MTLSIRISKEILRKREKGEWRAIKDMASKFFVSPSKIIREINELGRLVNKVLDSGGEVYFQTSEGPERDEAEVFPIYDAGELVNLGLMAYQSWTDKGDYSLRINTLKKEWRWHPSNLIYGEEVLEGIKEKRELNLD